MFNILNNIRKFFGGKSAQNPSENPAPSPKRNVGGGRPRIQFDIAAAYRLHYDKHMSYSALARNFGISKDTIIARLNEMHVQMEAERMRRASQAAVEKSQAQGQAAREAASRAQQVADKARRDAEWRVAHPAPPIQPKPPIITPPPVAVPVSPPEPISNYSALVAYYTARGMKDYKPDATRFFLVRGADNVKFGTGSEQFVIGIESWHKEYHDLDEFKNAKRIWVVIDPREDNKIFLYSLCQDIWIREKCTVVRSTTFDAVRARWGWLQRTPTRFSTHPSNYEKECRLIDDANFERSCHFQMIPAPNHTRELDALLAPPPEPEHISPFGGAMVFPDGSPIPPQGGGNDTKVPPSGDSGEEPAGFGY